MARGMAKAFSGSLQAPTAGHNQGSCSLVHRLGADTGIVAICVCDVATNLHRAMCSRKGDGRAFLGEGTAGVGRRHRPAQGSMEA